MSTSSTETSLPLDTGRPSDASTSASVAPLRRDESAAVQAVFLRALADHMEVHPWLATVMIHYHEHSRPGFHDDHPSLPVMLQLTGRDDPFADGFTRWALSLGIDTYHAADGNHDEMFLHAYGELGGHSVDVFTDCPAGNVTHHGHGPIGELRSTSEVDPPQRAQGDES